MNTPEHEPPADPRLEQAFPDPRAILEAPTLTPAEKRALLTHWKAEAMALQRAENENMGGGEPTRLLDVVEALTELDRREGADPDG